MPNSTRIICLGNSITRGTIFSNWPRIFQKELNGWKRNCYQVINKGKSGDTSVNLLDRYAQDVSPYLPGIVIIECGINDANHRPGISIPRVSPSEFQRNLSELYRMIHTTGGTAMFLINHAISVHVADRYRQGNGKSYVDNIEPFHDIVRDIVQRFNTPQIDIAVGMKLRSSATESFVGRDGVHLSRAGVRCYGEIVFSAVKSYLESAELTHHG
jgi:lysophospholipase L1-like esterase